ncbi:MAG: hypothetical protein ACE5I1_01080, partial [bacterium]
MLKNSISSIQETVPAWQEMPVCSTDRIKSTMAVKIERFFENAESRDYFNRSDKIVRFEIRIQHIDALCWLSAQRHPIKTYWCGREQSLNFGVEMAGIGFADVITASETHSCESVFHQMRSRLSSAYKNLRYYGGFRFYDDREVDECWKKFGSFRFLIPRWEIYTAGSDAYFACNILYESGQSSHEMYNDLMFELDNLHFDNAVSKSYFPYPTHREDSPDENTWRGIIEQALEAFELGDLQKVVLARKSFFTFPEVLEPLSLLRRIKTKNPNRFY